MIGNAVFYPGSAVVNTRLTGGILYALREGSVAAGRDTRGDQADQVRQRHALNRDPARAGYDRVEQAFPAEEDVLDPFDLLDVHRDDSSIMARWPVEISICSPA